MKKPKRNSEVSRWTILIPKEESCEELDFVGVKCLRVENGTLVILNDEVDENNEPKSIGFFKEWIAAYRENEG